MVSADDLVHLLSKVTEYEGYYMALCPYLHGGELEKNPSMMVGKDGWFKCLACGKRGSLEQLHAKVKGGRFISDADAEDEYCGLKPSPPRNAEAIDGYVMRCENDLHANKALQEFWRSRGLYEEARIYRLGVALGAWGTIPMVDRISHKPIRISFRAFHPDLLSNGVRYWNSPGPPILYIPRTGLVETRSKIAVCYGLIDAIAVSALGYAAVTPSSGKDSLKIEWLRDLGGKEVFFIPDEGEEATAIKHIQQYGMNASLIQLPYVEHDTSDPADYFANGKQEKLREYLKGYLDE
jgi:hypothetical protein